MPWLFLILLLSACSTTAPDRKLVENGLTLRYLPAIDTDKIHLQHPLQIDEAGVRRHLQSLWYEGLTPLGKKGRVFSDKDADKTARLLTKALNHASSGNVVQFELATPSGSTEAEVFAEGDKIHWRFLSIKGSVFKCEVSHATCLDSNWRLIPKEGQNYYLMEKLFGRKTMENWIVSEINLAAPKTEVNKSR